MSDVKQYTQNLNLTVIPVESTSVTFLSARDDVYGNKPTSNMQIIDTEVGKLKKRAVHLLTGESLVANQFTATSNNIPDLNTSFPVIFTPDKNNTGASTLTINSLSPKYIKKYDGLGVLVDLNPGDLTTNNPIQILYDAIKEVYVLVTSSVGSLPSASTGQSGIVMLTNDLDSTSETKAPTAAALKNVADDLQAAETDILGKAPKSHASTDTAYGAATGSSYGHAKLYNEVGDNTDGAITQKAASTAIADAKPIAGTGISITGSKSSTINVIPPADGKIGGVKAGSNISISQDGTISAPNSPTSLPPSGSAGGSLSGTYPDPSIANGAVTDVAIGSRTFNQSISDTFSSSGTLSQLGSWIVKVLKSIIGGDNWYDTPVASLKALSLGKANINHASRHATGELDEITPEDIGAEEAGTTAAHNISAGAHSTLFAGKQATITTSGLLKGNGSGSISEAISGTDYETPGAASTAVSSHNSDMSAHSAKFATKQAAITASGILKGDGAGSVTAAVAGTDYIASESDPTVPAWAKTESKPTYTASEVGADASGTATSAVSSHSSDANAHSTQMATKVSKSGDSMTGTLSVGSPAIGTQAVRNIYAGTSDMTPGSSSLSTGVIYLVYE